MLFHFFHRKTQPTGHAPRELIPFGRTAYKSYVRFPRVALPEAILPATSLTGAIEGRRSRREFDPAKRIHLRMLSSILWGAGIDPKRSVGTNEFGEPALRRRYPSGGALYPLEIYIGAHAIEGLDRGIYHYCVEKHALVHIADGDALEEIRHSTLQQDAIQNAAAIIMITAVWHRSSIKYGEFAYRATLLEAGHLAHNMLLLAEASGVASSLFSGFAIEKTDAALDLEGCNESLVHGFLIGYE